jgi:Uma2 family endonuclease
MTMPATTEELIELYKKVEGKAEIVNGEIIQMPYSGDLPASAAGAIHFSLREYAKRTRTGRAYPDGTVYWVDLPNRKSFMPDATFHTGERTGMKFLKGAPVFAVEVRSEGDYGLKAERNMAHKRADYFAAGTLVVWDVDLLSDDVIRVYRSTDPLQPTIYRRGQTAEASPAVPGWTFPVEELFE